MRTDVALLNFGGPQVTEEVEPFLRALFSDRDLIKLPLADLLQEPFAKLISKRRSPSVASHYAEIGGSPLVKTSQAQARALEDALQDLGVKVWLGMRYTEPSIKGMVEHIAKDPPDRLIALSLYPHFSITTTGSTFNAFSEELLSAGLANIPIHYIPAYFDHPLYLEAMTGLVQKALADLDEKAHVLFSAHGIPASYAKGYADPYPDQIKSAVHLLAESCACQDRFSLSFQSRVGPVRWIGPATEDEIRRLARQGTKDIVVVPMSFTSEGIETLYEIDVEFGEVATRCGAKLHRIPTVDTEPSFIRCLADLIRTALGDVSHEGIGQHRCVRCLLPKPQLHRTRVDCLDCGFKTPEYLLRLPSTIAKKG